MATSTTTASSIRSQTRSTSGKTSTQTEIRFPNESSALLPRIDDSTSGSIPTYVKSSNLTITTPLYPSPASSVRGPSPAVMNAKPPYSERKQQCTCQIDCENNVNEEDDTDEEGPVGYGQEMSPDDLQNGYSKVNRSVKLRLENKGSVARDHLASERTYLAYVRTSLAISGAGIALLQFLRLSTHTYYLSRPVGSCSLVFALLVLAYGTHRFFYVQRTLPKGFFPPASISSIGFISLVLSTLVVVVFAIVLAGAARGG